MSISTLCFLAQLGCGVLWILSQQVSYMLVIFYALHLLCFSSSSFSFSFDSIPCSFCSNLHGMNPTWQKKKKKTPVDCHNLLRSLMPNWLHWNQPTVRIRLRAAPSFLQVAYQKRYQNRWWHHWNNQCFNLTEEMGPFDWICFSGLTFSEQRDFRSGAQSNRIGILKLLFCHEGTGQGVVSAIIFSKVGTKHHGNWGFHTILLLSKKLWGREGQVLLYSSYECDGTAH